MTKTKKKTPKRAIPHVVCEGSREHVVSLHRVYDPVTSRHRSKRVCSEPQCEINENERKTK